jgi:hypothetical protein
VRGLASYEDFNRREVHAIFSPETSFRALLILSRVNRSKEK